MSMSVGGSGGPKADINMTPMIDVLQVLKDQSNFSKNVLHRPAVYHGLYSTHPREDKRLYDAVARYQTQDAPELREPERDFWSMKSEDIDLRPIYHYLENRVRAHVLLCMLATYLTWHLRQVLAPLTFTDNQKPDREDPVIPARRSAAAAAKDTAKITPDKLPIRGHQGLVAHLATLTRNTVSFAGQRLEKLSAPTPEQRRVFELLGKPIPLRLDAA